MIEPDFGSHSRLGCASALLTDNEVLKTSPNGSTQNRWLARELARWCCWPAIELRRVGLPLETTGGHAQSDRKNVITPPGSVIIKTCGQLSVIGELMIRNIFATNTQIVRCSVANRRRRKRENANETVINGTQVVEPAVGGGGAGRSEFAPLGGRFKTAGQQANPARVIWRVLKSLETSCSRRTRAAAKMGGRMNHQSRLELAARKPADKGNYSHPRNRYDMLPQVARKLKPRG